MVEIKIPNGLVRELEASDIPILTAMSQDKPIQDFYFVTLPESIETFYQERFERGKEDIARKWVVRTTYNLPIVHEDLVKGSLTIRVNPYEASRDDNPAHVIELSYFVGKEFRRQGLAESAVNAAVSYAFNDLNAGAVGGVCLVENVASHFLLKKAGMKKVWRGISEIEHSEGREVII